MMSLNAYKELSSKRFLVDTLTGAIWGEASWNRKIEQSQNEGKVLNVKLKEVDPKHLHINRYGYFEYRGDRK